MKQIFRIQFSIFLFTLFVFVLAKNISADVSYAYIKDEAKYEYYRDLNIYKCNLAGDVVDQSNFIQESCERLDEEGNPVNCAVVTNQANGKNEIGCFIQKVVEVTPTPSPSTSPRRSAAPPTVVRTPVVNVPSSCPLTKEEYDQCGGTIGLEDKPKTHTFHIIRYVDCNEVIKKYDPPQDLGDLGQCGSKTAKYRVAASQVDLTAAEWQPYTAGGVTVTSPSSIYKVDSSINKQAIFVQFLDSNDQIIKFSNGNDFTVEYINSKFLKTLAATIESSPTVRGSNKTWEFTFVKVTLSGFKETGNTLVGVFIRNETGSCSLETCGFLGWTKIKSYATNGLDQFNWTPRPGDLQMGVHMFGVFSLKTDGTADKLLGVSSTNYISR